MRKKLTPLPESTADRFNFDHALIVLTELTWLGEPKCLYGETLARLGGWPYHTIANTFCFSCKRFAKFCKATQCCNSSTYNPTQCSSWINRTQRRVGSLPPVTEETRFAPWNCQPFSPLCRPSHGRPHTTCRK